MKEIISLLHKYKIHIELAQTLLVLTIQTVKL